ncbi:MAG: Crp/Fnr family transcriptional regulator [Bacteroidales bacterium]|nr:Crp/Fnr family transcriptional regulator [Bacteroidales bacterium]
MSEEQIIELLVECKLFRGMNKGEISEVLSGHPGRIRHYSRGTLIAQAGDEVRSLKIILRGSVKGEMVDFTGKVIRIEDILPPRPLAPAFLFGSRNRYPVHISSAEDTLILSIPRELFLIMLQRSGKMLVNFMDIISSRGQFLSSKIKFLSFTTIKGKLAQYLLDLSRQSGSGTFMLPNSQSQLSGLFGVARPSIGRALGELNQKGIIRTVGKKVVILDPARLASYLK